MFLVYERHISQIDFCRLCFCISLAISWIIKINEGQFLKYNSTLEKNLKSDNVTGKALQYLNQLELRNIGIKDIRDRHDLDEAIKKLTQSREGQVGEK